MTDDHVDDRNSDERLAERDQVDRPIPYDKASNAEVVPRSVEDVEAAARLAERTTVGRGGSDGGEASVAADDGTAAPSAPTTSEEPVDEQDPLM
jgi:hypothetical protein